MDKENKNFTKNEERSFVISMVLTLQMDRKVEKKALYYSWQLRIVLER